MYNSIGRDIARTDFNYPARKAPMTDKSDFFDAAQVLGRSTGSESGENSNTNKKTTSSDSWVVTGTTSDGRTGVLYWEKDMLASVWGEGGTVNVKYHEDSTEEDPIAIAWGVDSNGKEYRQVIHLNDVDPNHATPAEMIALKSHLAKMGYEDAADAGPGALWSALGSGYDANTKMDFEKYYKEYIAMQQLANNKTGAALYQYELERFLFFHQQNEDKNSARI